MGDPKGPTKGWSRVLPTIKGWYEMGNAQLIDHGIGSSVRLWTDGQGTFCAPRLMTPAELAQITYSPNQVMRVMPGGNAVVLVPVHGSFEGAYFKALGPLLDPSLPSIKPLVPMKEMQDPTKYLTPSQKREADTIEENRPDAES